MPSWTTPAKPGSSEVRLDLGLLSVLLIDDNRFVRSVLRQTLRTLGVRQIEVMGSAAEAMDYLDGRRKQLPDGVPPVDLLISDYIMPETDGLELLGWLRTNARSPDRFVPVIMMSGAADENVVARARDLGANEFLAKPFTVKSISDRVVATIWKPRRFVLAPRFFGPDRRRFLREVEAERRATRPEDVVVLHSERRAQIRDDSRICHYDIPNRLLPKVGGGGRGVPVLDPADMREAETEVKSLVERNADWMAAEIAELARAVERLRQPDVPLGEAIAAVCRSAHELRGCGGVFGYPLMTVVAKSLYEMTNRTYRELGNRDFRVIQVHADAIRMIADLGLRGDGGATGQALVQSLRQLRVRVG